MTSTFNRLAPLLLAALILSACMTSGPGARVKGQTVPTPEELKKYCRETVGSPRVIKISDHVWVAVGYDQASTVLIDTPKGVVIVDAAGSPDRAEVVKKALFAAARSGPVAALVYTRCHQDNIGGALALAGENTRVWATEAFPSHYFNRFMRFQAAEALLDDRLSGGRVPREFLTCNRLGPGREPGERTAAGTLPPTDLFSGKKELDFGGMAIELRQFAGPDQDRLYVWVPRDGTLIGGDGFYESFPVFHSFEGSSPRSVDDWIETLDAMRTLAPTRLVPSHGRPILNAGQAARTLTEYRDALQWVRDEVIRGINRGEGPDELAANIGLPPHLAEKPFLKEIYGRIDWAARDIYAGYRGALAGRPENLFPLPAAEAASREIALMGGPEKVLVLAEKALMGGEVKWGVHLLSKLVVGNFPEAVKAEATRKLALGLEVLGRVAVNTIGRAYLLESAVELREGPAPGAPSAPNSALASRLPLEYLFRALGPKLKVEEAMDLTETAVFVFPDEKKRFVVTVRKGIVETVEGAPRPGTPDPVAVATFDSQDFRKVVGGEVSPYTLLIQGKIRVQGSWVGLVGFLGRFED
ncbi:MAG: alkyl sulfatase dimerization domain-containing protein [Pseudomonadota bacterium]